VLFGMLLPYPQTLQGWEGLLGANTLAYYKNLLLSSVKSFIVLAPGACIIKLITAVIYGLRNKLECLSLNIRLGWEGLAGANTY
jgi:hypothetical protein